MVYKVLLLKDGRDLEALYWNGALDETVDLARKTTVELGADLFRITECTEKEDDVYLEDLNVHGKQTIIISKN